MGLHVVRELTPDRKLTHCPDFLRHSTLSGLGFTPGLIDKRVFYGGHTRFITCSCPPLLPLPQFTDLGPERNRAVKKSGELQVDLMAKEPLRKFFC